MNAPPEPPSHATARHRLLEIFSEAVRSSGDRAAVVAGRQRLTYAELDRASGELSARLIARGVGAGTLVGVMTERTVHVAIAYFAALKAGAAFMPLAPDTPVQRNHLILRNSRASLLLTTRAALGPTAAEAYGRVAHLVDVETLEPSGRPCVTISNAVSPETAYVIHTSGSTGEPKGAANTFVGLLNLVEGLAGEIYPRDGRPRNVALVAPFTFDPSIQQLFPALLKGHCLHVCPEHARFDGGALLAFLNEAKIDVADGTPTHLRLLTNAPASGGDGLAASLLLIGGEALTPEILSAFWRRFAASREGVEIVNLYGTAECAVDSSFYRVASGEVERLGFVPIGRPLPNTELRVVDATGADCPEGEVGELVIGGAGVGAGYVGGATTGSERFFETPGRGRFYRTGDLGALHAGGLLRCLGRQDRQIKIRGVRIEPAEIELALREFRIDAAAPDVAFETCTRCLLDSRHPGVTVADGVCSACVQFDADRGHAARYFGVQADFTRLMAEARSKKRGAEDCLLLYSGGKDSSYVLLRLLELGYRVATFTFDNGYISRTALENIERTTREYGVRHVTVDLAQMKEVFAESLRYESTVCGGCFRALTLLSTELACKDGINVVITGLSRGQIFETKLKRLFDQGVRGPEEIDRRLQTHRQIFNVREDQISRAVGLNRVGPSADDGVHYVDFFRYDAASSADVRRYLVSRDERWRAPKDTGFCSTNCRINDVGIHVHRLEKGYHNYAAPLSWEVRLGVATRADAAHELEAPVGGDNVRAILDELRYTPRDLTRGLIQEAVVVRRGGAAGQPMLCGYFVSSGRVNLAELRAHLLGRLPENMVPKHLVRVDALPLTSSGKVDVARLPLPALAPASPPPPARERAFETGLHEIWREVLGIAAIEPDDNFFDLGGDSLLATNLVALVEAKLGKKASVIEAMHHPTLRFMTEFLASLPPVAAPGP